MSNMSEIVTEINTLRLELCERAKLMGMLKIALEEENVALKESVKAGKRRMQLQRKLSIAKRKRSFILHFMKEAAKDACIETSVVDVSKALDEKFRAMEEEKEMNNVITQLRVIHREAQAEFEDLTRIVKELGARVKLIERKIKQLTSQDR